jgi:hypothetical protein
VPPLPRRRRHQHHSQVAIDFTGSNGDPRTPSSLHYIDPRGLPNQYHLAIESVGGVLE